MTIFYAAVVIILILFIPRITLVLCSRFSFLEKLGAVFLCYLIGFILSFLIKDTSMASTLSEICIPLAIPLILFSTDLASLKKLAKPALISFALICISVILVSILGFLIFRHHVPYAEKISGMLVGLYTGGTPNLMAIGMALGLDQGRILITNTVDLIVGGMYFFLLISVMPKLVRSFLPPFKKSNASNVDKTLEEEIKTQLLTLNEPFTLKMLLSRLPLILLSIGSVLISLAASYVLTGNATDIMVVMLGVTTCGVALSFINKVRHLPGSYSTGTYFIYMFSVAMGLSFDHTLINSSAIYLLLMLLFVQSFSVIVHILLAKIFHIDADTTLITSTAGIYGPAFIPSVANALNNREVILTGLLCGILGYAIGNYIGIGTANILMLLF